MRNHRIANIDRLRGLAAVGVVLCHVAGQFFGVTRFSPGPERLVGWAGQVGVAVFFVVSGFCIRLPLAQARDRRAEAKLDVREYLQRRALRILPPYWLAIAVSIAAGLLAPIPLLDGRHGAPDIVLHLLGLHTLSPATFGSINGVFWTIGLELQFYMAYLLVAHRPASLGLGGALLALGLGVYAAAALVLPPWSPWRPVAESSMPATLWQWYLGAVLADAYVRKRPRTPPGPRRAAGLWGARLAAGGLCLALGLADPVVLRVHLVAWALPFAAAALTASLLARPAQDGAPGPVSAVLGFFGRVSYSLYLFHPAALALAALAVGRGAAPGWSAAPLALAASVLLAWGGYRLVERPFLRRQSVRAAAAGDRAAQMPPYPAQRRGEHDQMERGRLAAGGRNA